MLEYYRIVEEKLKKTPRIFTFRARKDNACSLGQNNQVKYSNKLIIGYYRRPCRMNNWLDSLFHVVCFSRRFLEVMPNDTILFS